MEKEIEKFSREVHSLLQLTTQLLSSPIIISKNVTINPLQNRKPLSWLSCRARIGTDVRSCLLFRSGPRTQHKKNFTSVTKFVRICFEVLRVCSFRFVISGCAFRRFANEERKTWKKVTSVTRLDVVPFQRFQPVPSRPHCRRSFSPRVYFISLDTTQR